MLDSIGEIIYNERIKCLDHRIVRKNFYNPDTYVYMSDA